VELVSVEVDRPELPVDHLDPFGVCAWIEPGVDLRAGAGRCASDQADDDLMAEQRLATPVLADEGEEVVLDPVPLAGPGREVSDVDLKTGLVSELLQTGLPEPRAASVGAARVGR
jgi:hypothetical protein